MEASSERITLEEFNKTLNNPFRLEEMDKTTKDIMEDAFNRHLTMKEKYAKYLNEVAETSKEIKVENSLNISEPVEIKETTDDTLSEDKLVSKIKGLEFKVKCLTERNVWCEQKIHDLEVEIEHNKETIVKLTQITETEHEYRDILEYYRAEEELTTALKSVQDNIKHIEAKTGGKRWRPDLADRLNHPYQGSSLKKNFVDKNMVMRFMQRKIPS